MRDPRPTRLVVPLVGAAAALLLSACGAGFDAPAASAEGGPVTVEVSMLDIAYDPTQVTVPAGVPVTFVFTNDGAAVHEAVLGDAEVQDEHEGVMVEGEMSSDEMSVDEGDHADDAVAFISLAPGESGEITHTFEEAGSTLIGCHVPGHYAAGMVMEVTVTG